VYPLRALSRETALIGVTLQTSQRCGWNVA